MLERSHRRRMNQEAYILSTAGARAIVRDAIVSVSAFRGWFLHALHVRTEHVHGVVEAECSAGRILNDWKAYATRSLRSSGLADLDRMIWTTGGNTRQVLSPESLRSAIRYVLDEQGQAMEMYSADIER
jgi:hypothetical protein